MEVRTPSSGRRRRDEMVELVSYEWCIADCGLRIADFLQDFWAIRNPQSAIRNKRFHAYRSVAAMSILALIMTGIIFSTASGAANAEVVATRPILAGH
jgi:hypothetical protein